MKKYITLLAVSVVILAGLYFVLSAPKQSAEITEKTTKELVTELISQKFNQPTNTLTIEVKADTGAFAKGIYNEVGAGGGVWFAAKTNNDWELVSTGNGIVPCSDIAEYNFPKDVITQCLDTENNNELIQR